MCPCRTCHAALVSLTRSPDPARAALRLPSCLRVCVQIQDSGRAHNVTVIGVVRGSGVRAGAAAAPDDGPLVELGVPPGKAPALTLQPGDKLVVLAEEAR